MARLANRKTALREFPLLLERHSISQWQGLYLSVENERCWVSVEAEKGGLEVNWPERQESFLNSNLFTYIWMWLPLLQRLGKGWSKPERIPYLRHWEATIWQVGPVLSPTPMWKIPKDEVLFLAFGTSHKWWDLRRKGTGPLRASPGATDISVYTTWGKHSIHVLRLISFHLTSKPVLMGVAGKCHKAITKKAKRGTLARAWW